MYERLIAVDYQQSRLVFFIEQYFKALYEMNYWSKQTSKSTYKQLLFHERASGYGAQVNYFKDALNAFGFDIEKFKSKAEAIDYVQSNGGTGHEQILPHPDPQRN